MFLSMLENFAPITVSPEHLIPTQKLETDPLLLLSVARQNERAAKKFE